MSKIANSFDTTVERLAADNNISNVNMIYANENLVINKEGNAVVAQPAAQTEQPATQQTTVQETTVTEVAQTTTITSSSAKDTLVNRESGGSYTASNGRYYGRYQLDLNYLNGDLSPANQDKVAEQYVANRYGTWENALAHSNATGWY